MDAVFPKKMHFTVLSIIAYIDQFFRALAIAAFPFFSGSPEDQFDY